MTYHSNANPIEKRTWLCEVCQQYALTQIHHVFQGRGRRNIPENPVIEVCSKCHRNIHEHPADYMWLKKKYQSEVMRENGWTVEQFIEKFGRNYLED